MNISAEYDFCDDLYDLQIKTILLLFFINIEELAGFGVKLSYIYFSYDTLHQSLLTLLFLLF
jgi:hypothetical protein